MTTADAAVDTKAAERIRHLMASDDHDGDVW